ncbi:energy transducer TonB [Flavobacterium luminosum]|uniref:Energy transducer TonB n=1 Tax=Flavobacterium luminosum TaxID=2949086 RepID=A0ABT0TRE9_9FLAO|nr:energy transducer TonB [Flavobacterium sp. HXWNR70]MCL9810081.1 energy transducer TonB [Flavobacterium sp. HXWNR70]
MRYFKLILLTIILILVSCEKKKNISEIKISSDSIIVKSIDEFYKTKSKKVKIVDTLCIFEQKRAQEDVKKNKLVYTLHYGIGVYDFSNFEMNELLAKHSITLDTILIPCSRPPKGFKWYCYSELMNKEIEKRFGEKFIDSLRNIADRKFVENNPKFVFSFSDCETNSRYETAKTYEDFLEKPENDFIKSLNYKNLTKQQLKKEKANSDISFVIYRNGTIGNIKVQTDFNISKNKDFIKYFEKEAIKFVKNAKWKSATYRGIKVNSEMYLNLYNK